MGYWEKIGGLDRLIEFSTTWKTLKDLEKEFKLSPMESWRCFSRIIKHYDEFEYRDANNLKAGQPKVFRVTELALNTFRLKKSIKK